MQRKVLAVQNEAFVAQVGEIHRRSSGQRMTRMHDQLQRVFDERQYLEIFVTIRQRADDANVQGSFVDALLDFF